MQKGTLDSKMLETFKIRDRMCAAKRFEMNILKGDVVSDKARIDPPLNTVTMPNSDLPIEIP